MKFFNNKIIFLIIFFYFVIAPTLTFIHEFGHALVPLIQKQQVVISIGDDYFTNINFQNLILNLGIFKPWIGLTTTTSLYSNTILFLILGPMFSLTIGLLLLYFGIKLKIKKTAKKLMIACAGWCIFQFLFTIIPCQYPKFLGYHPNQISDGKVIKKLIFK